MKKVGSKLYLGLVFLFLYAPILVMIFFSFNASSSKYKFTGFSLRWYARLFNDSALMEALPGLAALAAKCLQKHGAPVFASAQEVLQVLSAEEIHAVAAAYADWSAAADPGMDSGEETIEALKKGSGTRRRNACAGVC